MSSFPHGKRRIFYVASLVLDPAKRRVESPAARNKVLGVCAAIRAAGATPVIITAVGREATSPRKPLRVVHRDGVCFVEVFNVGSGLARRLSALLFLPLAALRFVGARDRVLLYNGEPEFLLLALCLRILRRPAMLDIEDAPRTDDSSPLGRLIAATAPLLRRLCDRRAVVASRALGEQLGLRQFLPVYGVSSFFTASRLSRDAFSDAETRILFGGSILPDTGSDLFIAALRELATLSVATPLHFYVTGRFKAGLFDALATEMAAVPNVRFSVVQDLDTDAYAALVRTMDVGLCLKLPSSEMGRTTFPSKVVEITALGMLLVSTRVSDVDLIFDAESAVLLASEAPTELAAILAEIAMDRSRFAAIALRGKHRATDRFSDASVGNDLVRFMTDTEEGRP